MKVEAEALDTSLTQRGSQWPVSSAVLVRAVEQNETAYGLNTIRARPVSLVQVRHACACVAPACVRMRRDVAQRNFEGKSRGHVKATRRADTRHPGESRETRHTDRCLSQDLQYCTSMLCLIACVS